jgi:hypothetical protein
VVRPEQMLRKKRPPVIQFGCGSQHIRAEDRRPDDRTESDTRAGIAPTTSCGVSIGRKQPQIDGQKFLI